MQNGSPRLLFLAITLSSMAIIQLMPVSSGQRNFGNDFDVDKMLADKKYVRKQINCVLDNGPCDSFGSSIKASIPEVIARNCQGCNPTLASNARKVVSYVKQQHPDVWNQVLQKYS